jgi:uncharacterized metal-binding protein YceD (DUF177 family)
MKVVLDSLRPEGRTVVATLGDAWLSDATRQVVGARPHALAAELKVTKDADKRFRVTGALSVGWQISCDRCLRLLSVTLGGDVDLLYQRGGLPDAEDVELQSGDLDLGWIEGGSIDLADVVAEQLALWKSDRVVCADPGSMRVDSEDEGLCELPKYDGGPALQKKSAFSALANWKPPQ